MKAQGHIHSLAIFSDLYPRFITDKRFTDMLGQPGSTPLDLFKFYVKDLRDNLPSEKKMVKDLLKEKEVEVTAEMTFDDFVGDITSIKVFLRNLIEFNNKEFEKVKVIFSRVKSMEVTYAWYLPHCRSALNRQQPKRFFFSSEIFFKFVLGYKWISTQVSSSWAAGQTRKVTQKLWCG